MRHVTGGMEGWDAEDIRGAVIDQLQQMGQSDYAEDLWSAYADSVYDDAEDGLSAYEIAEGILLSEDIVPGSTARRKTVATDVKCRECGKEMNPVDALVGGGTGQPPICQDCVEKKTSRRKQADFGSAQVALEITAEMPTAAAEWLADQFEQMIYDGTIISDDAWEVFGVSSVSVIA